MELLLLNGMSDKEWDIKIESDIEDIKVSSTCSYQKLSISIDLKDIVGEERVEEALKRLEKITKEDDVPDGAGDIFLM